MNQTEIFHDQFPLVQRLRQAHIDRQDVDFNKIIFSGIPWLPLSVNPPKLDANEFEADIKKWFYPEGLTIDSLQNTAFTQSNWVGHNTTQRLESEPEQRLWQGRILFGPEDWLTETYTGTLYVEYTMARRFRNKMQCAWALDANHPIRLFVQNLVQEHNLELDLGRHEITSRRGEQPAKELLHAAEMGRLRAGTAGSACTSAGLAAPNAVCVAGYYCPSGSSSTTQVRVETEVSHVCDSG